MQFGSLSENINLWNINFDILYVYAIMVECALLWNNNIQRVFFAHLF